MHFTVIDLETGYVIEVLLFTVRKHLLSRKKKNNHYCTSVLVKEILSGLKWRCVATASVTLGKKSTAIKSCNYTTKTTDWANTTTFWFFCITVPEWIQIHFSFTQKTEIQFTSMKIEFPNKLHRITCNLPFSNAHMHKQRLHANFHACSFKYSTYQ